MSVGAHQSRVRKNNADANRFKGRTRHRAIVTGDFNSFSPVIEIITGKHVSRCTKDPNNSTNGLHLIEIYEIPQPWLIE